MVVSCRPHRLSTCCSMPINSNKVSNQAHNSFQNLKGKFRLKSTELRLLLGLRWFHQTDAN